MRYSYSPVKQRSLLRSRGALLRPGFAFPLFHPPHEGRAERRKAQIFCCRAVGRDWPCLARRGARPAGRARLSALHRGDFGSGAALPSPHFLRISAASSSQPGRNAWRAGSRTSRGFGYEPRPQDATPHSAFGSSSETAPQMSEDVPRLTPARNVVNPISSYITSL